jgi:hypothetical protein
VYFRQARCYFIFRWRSFNSPDLSVLQHLRRMYQPYISNQVANMIPETDNGLEGLDPATWDLQSFTINHESKMSVKSRLYLDRANGEFGIVSSPASAITTLAQYHDDEPIYFQGKTACAVSWRAKCKKVSLLFKHSQIDLEFAQVEEAHNFVHALEEIAKAAGNPSTRTRYRCKFPAFHWMSGSLLTV